MIIFPVDLPKYGATEDLKKAIIAHIIKCKMRPGDEFFSDRQISEASGRSRSTVRRALDQLQQENWIDRRGGVGTFIGSMSAVPQKVPYSQVISSTSDKTIRVAVVDSGINEKIASMNQCTDNTWFGGNVLRGLDTWALQENFIVEYMGYYDYDSDRMIRRFEQSCPDIIINVGPPSLPLISEALRRDIPAVLALMKDPSFGVINIYEDNFDAMRRAVTTLHALGHTRIGFLQVLSPSWWSIDRYCAWLAAMKDVTDTQDNGLALLIPDSNVEAAGKMVTDWYQREKPTAVICGCYHVIYGLRAALDAEKLVVPRDLSIISYDQNPVVRMVLGGIQPNTIELPSLDIGTKIGELIRPIYNRETLSRDVMVPCTLSEGDTIASI